MRRSAEPGAFLTAEEAGAVKSAIGQAERGTSAELKVVITRHCWTSVAAKAAGIFRKLGLNRTQQRNCAMILVVTANREFLIHGDQGIHEKVGQEFWDDCRNAMMRKFQDGKMGEALCEGIRRIGGRLAEHFPSREGDKNEISDEVVYT
jgi:uncharacterized membrane protein